MPAPIRSAPPRPPPSGTTKSASGWRASARRATKSRPSARGSPRRSSTRPRDRASTRSFARTALRSRRGCAGSTWPRAILPPNYRDLVRDLDSAGAASRASVAVRSIWAYRSQARWLAAAAHRFRAGVRPRAIARRRRPPHGCAGWARSLAPLADWLTAHDGLLANGAPDSSILFGVLALLAQFLARLRLRRLAVSRPSAAQSGHARPPARTRRERRPPEPTRRLRSPRKPKPRPSTRRRPPNAPAAPSRSRARPAPFSRAGPRRRRKPRALSSSNSAA